MMQQYIQLYHQLTIPTLSKQANKQLLLIENTQEAWNLALQMISNSDSQIQMHGYQLLSKKLNVPPPQNIELRPLLVFLTNQQNNPATLFHCIAKILVHLNPTEKQLQALPHHLQLPTLAEIPWAISHVRTLDNIDSKQIKHQYLQQNMLLLFDCYNNQKKKVIDTLEAFLTNNTRLHNQALLQLLLQEPFQDVKACLEQILLHEQYSELTLFIFEYLHKNVNQIGFFPVYLSFVRNIALCSLDVQQLQFVLTLILQQMDQSIHQDNSEIDEEEQSHLHSVTDSFELWHKLSQEAQSIDAFAPNKDVIEKAFGMVWNIVCKRSILKVLPQKINSHEGGLGLGIIDLDADDESLESNDIKEQISNFKPEQFRTYAVDFLSLCITNIKQQHLLQQLFAQIKHWASSSLLQMQLTIFLIDSIIDFAQPNHYTYISNITQIIILRAQEFNELLCQRVLCLFSKMTKIVNQDSSLLVPILTFTSKALLYKQLALLASESLLTLLEESAASQQTTAQNLEAFLQQLSTLIFEQSEAKVLHNFIRTIVVFIHKFKKDPNTYAHFLTSLIPLLKPPHYHLESVLLAQIWLNQQKEKLIYLAPFQLFIKSNIHLFALPVQPSKLDIPEYINRLNLAIKSQSVNSLEPWLQILAQALKHLQPIPPYHLILTPFSNLIFCSSESNLSIILNFLQPYHSHIDQPILSHKEYPQYQLNYLQLHLKIIIGYKQSKTFSNYNPSTPLALIKRQFQTSNHQQFIALALAYLNTLITLQYPPQPVLDLIVPKPSLAESSSHHYIQLLQSIYQLHQLPPITQSFLTHHQNISQSLITQIQQSLQNHESKQLKNALLCL